MSFLPVAVFVAALIVLVVTVAFTLHRDYHAGFIGTFGLMLLGIGATARLADIWGGGLVAPFHVLVWVGLALFLGRQAWVWWWRRGAASWYPAGDCAKQAFDPERTVPQSERRRFS